MQALQEKGHHAICEPLTQIFLNHTARSQLAYALQADPEAVLITSRNGAQALAALTELRDMMVLCVGDSTEAAAQSAGFTRTCSCGGNVQSMADYIVDAYDADSRFVYVSAEHTREDLPALLQSFGMQTEQVVAYSAVASETLSETLVEHIKREQVDGIIFLSQRTAEIFMTLARNAGIAEELGALTAYCISETAAEPLQKAGWKQLAVAKQATLASVVASVDNA
jgi:uroporphyrinogen-III synthase